MSRLVWLMCYSSSLLIVSFWQTNTWAYHLSFKSSIAVRSARFSSSRSTLCRRHFKTHFLDKNRYFDWKFTEIYYHESPDNKSALVLVVAWCQTGNIHYLYQLMTQFIQACVCVSPGLNESKATIVETRDVILTDVIELSNFLVSCALIPIMFYLWTHPCLLQLAHQCLE